MRLFLLCFLVACSDPPAEGCTSAVDCAAGQLCREGACITPAPCDRDDDCAGGTVCQGGACRPLPCDDINLCTDGRLCVGGFCTAGQGCPEGGDCGLPVADCGILCADAGGCSADDQCPADQYCAPEGCTPGCRPDGSGCAAGETCDAATHICRCAEDAACAEGTYCADGACVPGCREDSCPEPTICLADSRTCGCERDDDCPAGDYCAEGACTEGCRVGAGECAPDGLCDPETHRCGPPGNVCQRDLDCPPEDYCLEGRGCAPGCREGGCAAGLTCDLASRECRCVDDLGCAAGTFCDGGLCSPGCRVNGEGCSTGSCDPATHRCHCENDAQCIAGQYCNAGLCTEGCRLAPDDCEVGRCNAENHVCEAGSCVRDADCPGQQACLLLVVEGAPVLRCGAALAEGRAEAPCRTDLNCASRLCLEAGHCFSACERDADCPGRRCVTVSITVDEGDPVEFQTCAPALVLCGGDVDCPMGQACLPSGDDPNQPARPIMACRLPGPGLPGGAACAEDRQCANNVCFQGACWQACTVGGANHCPAGKACYANQFHFTDDHGTPALPADDRFWGMAACLPNQGSDAPCPDGRCPGGEVCTMRRNQLNQAFDQVCRTPAGASPGGGACRVDTDCQTDVCFNNGICLGLCDPRNPAGQCAGGTQCSPVNVVVYERDPANPDDDLVDELNACFP